MGAGMGLFNPVGTLSGAIGAAIVGRLLDGGGLNFSLLPHDSPGSGYAFSNLAPAFALLTVLAGFAYFRARGSAAKRELAKEANRQGDTRGLPGGRGLLRLGYV